MPEKRKTELESEVNPSSSKRARQQLSYADLGDHDEARVTVNNGVSREPSNYESDGRETAAHNDKNESTEQDGKQNNQQRYNTRPRVDPVYGQRSAFPGLDDLGSDELFYGPAEDGLEYLRMVRSEANSLPTLFVATKATTQTTDDKFKGEEKQDEMADAISQGQQASKEDENQDGFVVVDGVFIATSVAADVAAEEVVENVQSSYHNMLRHRFIYLRNTLRCSPPATAISSLDETHPITFPYHVKGARLVWRRIIFSSDPQMVQLACMDMDTVLNVLRLLGAMISECIKGQDAVQLRRIGAWVWGLLGRCRDVGELTSEEVGELRSFGKRAVSALAKLNKLETETSHNDVAEPGPEDNKSSDDEEEEEEEAAAAASLPAQSADEPDDGQEQALEVLETVAIVGNSTDEIDSSSALPTIEPTPADEVETMDDLEAAKARLQSRLLVDVEPEEQEFKADRIARQRRNTSSPLDEDEALAEEETYGVEPEEDLQNTPQNRDKQTRALLNMIITIVGEFYGQRDLLPQRDIW